MRWDKTEFRSFGTDRSGQRVDPITRTVSGVGDQVWLKPSCSQRHKLARDLKFRIHNGNKRCYTIKAANNTKVLIRLHGCAGRSAPLLFAYGINRFSHDMAHISAGKSTQVPEVRVGYTYYPGTNLLPVTRMLILECINKTNSKQIEQSLMWLACINCHGILPNHFHAI